MTDLLKQHPHIREVRGTLRARLVKQCTRCDGTLFRGRADYQLKGLEGVPKYVKDYSTLLTGGQTGNLAVTYLGSYRLEYRVTRIDCKHGAAQVHFWVYNESKVSSGSRPPVIGYTEWWERHVGSGLDRALHSGPMSKTVQQFNWDETVRFRGKRCCKGGE